MNQRTEHHIDEEVLEAFVIDPAVFRRAERDRIDAHLEQCTACRAIADFFRDIYEHFHAQPDPDPERVERFLDALFPVPNVIELKPLHASHFQPLAYSHVVAADTPPPASKRIETVATLANDEENVLLRILLDHRENVLRCYLLTDDPRKRAHARVSLNDGEMEFTTDAVGKGVAPGRKISPQRAQVKYMFE